jgi:F420-dependent oxidoreductase-like protein
MRFSFWPAPTQPWEEVLFLARHVESTGWDGIWFADHFMPNAENTDVPWSEAWTTLAALAAVVPRVRLGPLVTGNTYRHPAVLAKMAATVDHISGGRVVLGLGAGWQENEHRAYGITFDSLGGRMRRFDEACRVIKALFSNDESSFQGDYYQLRDAPLVPKPVQQPLPLMIGGGGEKVTLRITAKYADEWNVWGTVDILKHKMTVLDQHCDDVGRDPADIERSAVAMLVLSDDAAVLEKMRKREHAMPTNVGNVEEIRQIVGAYAEAGVDEFIVPAFNLGPRERALDVLDQFIEEVVQSRGCE